MQQQKTLVLNHECCYDVILGADCLKKAGINLKYSTNTIKWFDNELFMQDPWSISNNKLVAMMEVVEQQCKEVLFGMDWYNPDCYAIKILDAMYNAVSVNEVVQQWTHLNAQQQAELNQVLQDFSCLFSGKLGVHPHNKFHIAIKPGAYHALTWQPSRRSLNISSNLVCSLNKAQANGALSP